MAKYPGSFIIHEYGTNKELANIYGVSERTIYRWKQKAFKETGAKPRKPKRPRTSTLQKFKGTRKELAKKYGVSERTAYRWLAKAREQGAEIESRQKKAKYPGAFILNEYGTNKELASIYGVSERTIARWKRRARSETQPEIETPTQPAEDPKTEEPKSDFYEELFGDSEEHEETTEEPFNNFDEDLNNISNSLLEFDLLAENSVFNDLDADLKKRYLFEYIWFKFDENPMLFYVPGEGTPEAPDFEDVNHITNINIWGNEFESWLKNQIEVDNT